MLKARPLSSNTKVESVVVVVGVTDVLVVVKVALIVFDGALLVVRKAVEVRVDVKVNRTGVIGKVLAVTEEAVLVVVFVAVLRICVNDMVVAVWLVEVNVFVPVV